MIRNNVYKYSVSAMCKVLKISRSSYYYEAAQKIDESDLVERIKEIFRISRDNYGTRKIKKELAKEDLIVSRRRIYSGAVVKTKIGSFYNELIYVDKL